jgi:lycopene cyclase CruP
MHVGDAGSNQSPLSFGGFGSLLRHLPRLTSALGDALAVDGDILLRKEALAAASPAMPTISVTWLFNKFMSAPRGSRDGDYLINRVLALNMKTMENLGPDIQRKFLQDVVQAEGLLKILALMTATQPFLSLQLLPRIGGSDLLTFLYHFAMLIKCSAETSLLELRPLNEAKLDPIDKYYSRRRKEASLFGSGRDHRGMRC